MTNPPRAILLTPGGRLTRIPLEGRIRQVLAEHLQTDHIVASPVGFTGIDVWHPSLYDPEREVNLGALRLWHHLTRPDDKKPPRLTGPVVLGGHDFDGEPTGLSIDGNKHLRQVFDEHSQETCWICRYARHRVVRPPVRD
jgi:hypothetical protein